MRWPIGWRKISSFSMKRTRIGRAVTAQDAADDLHYHQRRVILRPAQPPEEIRHGENNDHADQKNFRCAHEIKTTDKSESEPTTDTEFREKSQISVRRQIEARRIAAQP